MYDESVSALFCFLRSFFFVVVLVCVSLLPLARALNKADAAQIFCSRSEFVPQLPLLVRSLLGRVNTATRPYSNVQAHKREININKQLSDCKTTV